MTDTTAMLITDEQRDYLAACEKLQEIFTDGFRNGIWGETDSAPYPLGTEGCERWTAGYRSGAQQRFETLGYWRHAERNG